MPLTKTQSPYEFLVRWKDGKIAGAHVKFLERVIDDDGVTVLSEKEGMAQPVSMAGEVGYPIADIFAAIHTDSVATAQAAVTAVADAMTKQGEADKAKAEADTAVAASEAAKQAAEDQATADKAAYDLAHPGVPPQVTMKQARLALLGAGMLDKVQTTIDGLPEPMKQAATIQWDYSSTVERANGLVAQLAPALGLSSAQVDALFIVAAKL